MSLAGVRELDLRRCWLGPRRGSGVELLVNDAAHRLRRLPQPQMPQPPIRTPAACVPERDGPSRSHRSACERVANVSHNKRLRAKQSYQAKPPRVKKHKLEWSPVFTSHEGSALTRDLHTTHAPSTSTVTPRLRLWTTSRARHSLLPPAPIRRSTPTRRCRHYYGQRLTPWVAARRRGHF